MGFVGPVINGLLLTQISELKLVTLTPVSQPRNCLDTVFLREQFWDLFCFCYILLRFFKNTPVLKFKCQLTFAFFAGVKLLRGQKQKFTWMHSKGYGLWFVICGFCESVLCVSLFQSSLLVIVIMIDGSKKRICEGSFWSSEFVACFWKALLYYDLPNCLTYPQTKRMYADDTSFTSASADVTHINDCLQSI